MNDDLFFVSGNHVLYMLIKIMNYIDCLLSDMFLFTLDIKSMFVIRHFDGGAIKSLNKDDVRSNEYLKVCPLYNNTYLNHHVYKKSL